jgi:hypothetical protein
MAQDQPQTEEDLLEMLRIGELDYTAYRDLLELMRGKINLNSDDITRLTTVPGMDPLTVDEILRVRDSLGGFSSVSNLRLVPGLDLGLVEPFVCVEQYAPWWHGQVACQTREYFQADDTASSTGRMLIEIRNHVTIKGRMETSTPGQPIWQERTVVLHDAGPVQQVTLGNFRASCGQKLVLGGDNRMTGTAAAAALHLSDSVDTELETADLNSALDGVMTVMGLPNVRGMFCYAGEDLFQVLSDGQRTSMVRDRLAGMDLAWNGRGIGLGATGLCYRVTGNRVMAEQSVLGMHAGYNQQQVTLNAEAAAMPGAGKAVVLNGQWRHKKTVVKLAYHRYDPDFENPYGRAVAHGVGADEEGWWAKTEVGLPGHWSIWGSGDFWQTLSARQAYNEQKLGVTQRAPDGYIWKLMFTFRDDDPASGDGASQTCETTGGLPLGRHGNGTASLRFRQYADRTYGGALWLQAEFTVRTFCRLTGKITYADYDWQSANDAYGRCWVTEETRLAPGWTLEYTYGCGWDEGRPAIAEQAIRIKTVGEW